MDNPRKLVPLPLDRGIDLTTVHGSSPTEGAAAPATGGTLEERVIAALKTCYDPELPVNIYELGLIYELKIEPAGEVSIHMTLTSPGCPVADSLVREVQSKVEAVPGVTAAKVELVWEPPWDKSRMSEAALLTLGLL
jgi:FeS assembly SUF system protein